MKGLLLTTSLSLAIAAAPMAFAEEISRADQAMEYQVAAADAAQVDAFLKDSRSASDLSLLDLRARIRSGRALIQAGGLDPAKAKQIRSKLQEARTELNKRGSGGATDQKTQQATNQGSSDSTAQSTTQAKPKPDATEKKTAQSNTQATSSPEVAGYLAETPDLKTLDEAALRKRIQTGRSFISANQLTGKQRQAVISAVRAARAELASRGQQKPTSDQAGNTSGQKTEESKQQTTQDQTQPGSSSADVQSYLGAKPDLKSLDQAALRNRIRTGRELLKNSQITRADRRAVIEATRAANAELKSRAAGGTGQGNQNQGQQQTGQSGNQQNQQQGGNANTLMPADEQAAGYLNQRVELKTMKVEELNRRIRAGNQILALQGLSPANKQSVAQAVEAAKGELQARNSNAQQGSDGTGQASNEVNNLLNDSRSAQSLSEKDLNSRLRQLRAVLAQPNLPQATQRSLRQKLAGDRTELRKRIAERNNQQQGGSQNQQGSNQNQQERPVQRPAEFYLTDRRPPRDLPPWDLRQRILRLNIIINDNSYPQARRDEYARILREDRAELRRRYLVSREDRWARLRAERESGKLNIGINIVLGSPPPVVRGYPVPVYVAEAEDEEIERQFVAPPVRKPARRYTVDEVINDEEVRQTMPAVELDSIKFGFNEDFIREEALDDMDKVGDVIEKILVAHPDEIFLIEGHTDAVGSDNYNLDLSKRRAAAVKEALTTYFNIKPENLKTVGYGERYLKIPTPEEEPENRRATIRRVTPLVGDAS